MFLWPDKSQQTENHTDDNNHSQTGEFFIAKQGASKEHALAVSRDFLLWVWTLYQMFADLCASSFHHQHKILLRQHVFYKKKGVKVNAFSSTGPDNCSLTRVRPLFDWSDTVRVGHIKKNYVRPLVWHLLTFTGSAMWQIIHWCIWQGKATNFLHHWESTFMPLQRITFLI